MFVLFNEHVLFHKQKWEGVRLVVYVKTGFKFQVLHLHCADNKVRGDKSGASSKKVRSVTMVIQIKKVLVADAVDKVCVELLKNNSITVDCKYKLTKEQLIDEIKVSFYVNARFLVQSKCFFCLIYVQTKFEITDIVGVCQTTLRAINSEKQKNNK